MDLELELKKVPKLIDRVREIDPSLYIVGFKAETGLDRNQLISEARDVMDRAGLDLVAANDASVMGSDETHVEIVEEDWIETVEGSKREVADSILDKIERDIEQSF